MRIDDTRPIWIQLADSFRARITDGTWKPGQKIPSVRDLAIEPAPTPTPSSEPSPPSTTKDSPSPSGRPDDSSPPTTPRYAPSARRTPAPRQTPSSAPAKPSVLTAKVPTAS